MIKKSATVQEVLNGEKSCPFSLPCIPNFMGINLCSVKNIEWTEQENGELVDLTINFLPAEPEEASQQ